MDRGRLDNALAAVRRLYDKVPALGAFVAMPETPSFSPDAPYHIPAAERVLAETWDGPFADEVTALLDVHGDVEWRVTYRDTYLEADYRKRFACYRLIGPGGPYETAAMAGFLLYATPDLVYPWHHHPAEELYLILDGEAEFQAEGQATQTMRAGDTCFHASKQPHRMTTYDRPVLCWVAWRPPFMDVAPVLTEREVRA